MLNVILWFGFLLALGVAGCQGPQNSRAKRDRGLRQFDSSMRAQLRVWDAWEKVREER